jgi:methyltransferase (TIGR00027 family)
MRDGQASYTSRFVFFLRALMTHSPETHIFHDPVAERLLSPLGRRLAHRRWVYRLMARRIRRQPQQMGFMATILLRARFGEDELERAMDAEGVRQYVILGAGWDTFAWRRPELMQRLQVFELDHPATQRAKRDRLAREGFPAPDNLVFVPIDFTTQSLGTRLKESGFDPALPTFVNWMGVTYYLPKAVVEEVFRELHTLCAGGVSVAFDYADAGLRAYVDSQSASFQSRWRRRIMDRAVARVGEPFKSQLDAKTLPAWFAARGYELKKNLSSKQLRDYLPHEEMGPFVPRGLVYLALAHSPPYAP